MRCVVCLLLVALGVPGCQSKTHDTISSSPMPTSNAVPVTASPAAYNGPNTDCASVAKPGGLVTNEQLNGGCTYQGSPHYWIINTCPNGTEWTYDTQLLVAGAVGKTWVVADEDPRAYVTTACE